MKGLWKYLGILNFYRRFLLKAAEIVAPFNDLLHGDIKGKALVTWMKARRAFEGLEGKFGSDLSSAFEDKRRARFVYECVRTQCRSSVTTAESKTENHWHSFQRS